MTNELNVKVERMHFLDGDAPLKAFCDLMICNTFIVKGFRVVQGKEGLFLGMPQEQGRDEKWYNTFFTVSRDTQKQLENMVISAYREKTTAGR